MRELVNVTIGEPLRLYPGDAPGTESWSHDEMAYASSIFDTDVVTNVVVPTLTPVLPERGSATAVIVAPGGGFHALSINSEGYDAARWLAARGVAAFVLKYRLVLGGVDTVAELSRKAPEQAFADMDAVAPMAGDDGIAAVRLVREHAATFDIDPARVGFLGFSAGGNVALRVAYAPHPAARPDFVAPIYAAVRGVDLQRPPEGSGPMFIAAATDDSLGLAADSVEIYTCWRNAGLPVEMHLYARGGHGFGMRVQHTLSDTWIDRFGDWLGSLGLLEPLT